MKKIVIGIVFALTATSANANFFDNNSGEWKMGPSGPYYDESDWPEWTPMYWMEKFMDEMGGNNASPMMRYQSAPQANYAQPMMPAPQAPFPPVAPAK